MTKYYQNKKNIKSVNGSPGKDIRVYIIQNIFEHGHVRMRFDNS